MSDGIEVNTAYKGVAASWLGLDPNFYSKKRRAVDDDDAMNGGGSHFTKVKNTKKKDETRSGTKNNLTKHQSSTEKKKSEVIKTNGLIKNKIEKRLQFNGRDKHTEFKGKKRKFLEEEVEEESKSFQVKNRKINPPTAASTSQGQTIKELNTRLLDPSLSKKARKRIRKKIASLAT